MQAMTAIGKAISEGIAAGFASRQSLVDPHQQSIYEEQKTALIEAKYKKLEKRRADTITAEYVKQMYTAGPVIIDVLEAKSKNRTKGERQIFQKERFASAAMIIIADNWSKNKKEVKKVENLIKKLEEVHQNDMYRIAKEPEEINEWLKALMVEIGNLRDQVIDPIARLAINFLCNIQEAGSNASIILESLNKTENKDKGCQDIMIDLGLHAFKIADIVKDRKREEQASKERAAYIATSAKTKKKTTKKTVLGKRFREACKFGANCTSLVDDSFKCEYFHAKWQQKAAKKRKTIAKPAEEQKDAE
eukprot:480493_1